MNYLSHYAVALRVDAQASPLFYIGCVLPDLVSTSGVGRLRARNLANAAEPPSDLARGVALHLATDKTFHGHPAFAQAQASAKAALLAVPFSSPPTRVFFLVHALVEIALDGLLLRENPAFADEFYARFATVNLDEIAREAGYLLDHTLTAAPPPALLRTLRNFTEHRYLSQYATGSGQAEALHLLSRRVGLPGWGNAADHALLARLFDTFTPTLAPLRDTLLAPPPVSPEK